MLASVNKIMYRRIIQMKKFTSIVLFLLTSTTTLALDNKVSPDLKQLAQNYFQKMVATQAPSATKKDLEAYLELLTDDVGHTHLPWEIDGSRLPDGKQAMRKGMTFYLGAHTEYKAELLSVHVYNHSAISIRYKNFAKGIHPQNNQAIEYSQTMMEVLEMEGDKVAVIRKYHE